MLATPHPFSPLPDPPTYQSSFMACKKGQSQMENPASIFLECQTNELFYFIFRVSLRSPLSFLVLGLQASTVPPSHASAFEGTFQLGSSLMLCVMIGQYPSHLPPSLVPLQLLLALKLDFQSRNQHLSCLVNQWVFSVWFLDQRVAHYLSAKQNTKLHTPPNPQDLRESCMHVTGRAKWLPLSFSCCPYPRGSCPQPS